MKQTLLLERQVEADDFFSLGEAEPPVHGLAPGVLELRVWVMAAEVLTGSKAILAGDNGACQW